MKIPSLCIFCSAALLAAYAAAATVENKSTEKNATFDLKEVPIFDTSNPAQFLWRTANASCSAEPSKKVKAYPKLNSKRPLYGTLQLVRTPAGKEEAPIYFVLDESGERPAAVKDNEEKNTEKAAQKPGEKAKPNATRATVAKPARLSSYDRLYIDANRDGDLTNDPVLKPLKNPPWTFLPNYGGNLRFTRLVVREFRTAPPPSAEKERMAFEPAAVDIDYGPDVGVNSFKVFPWFILGEKEKTPTMRFAAGTVRKGTIKVGSDEYEAMLMPSALTGRFDRSTTALALMRKNTAPSTATPSTFTGYSSEMLGIIQRRGDDFYTINATPLGDKLMVDLYAGPFSVLRVAAGDRELKGISFSGNFRSDRASFGISPDCTRPAGGRTMATDCKLPIGDYPTFNMIIDYGGLQVSLSNSYYFQGQPRNMQKNPPRGIQIRENKPFVLGFSNKPEVMFVSPPTDKPLKRGTDVRIATVLVDPKLDIMVRGLWDPKRTTKETVRYRDGKEMREYTYNKVFSYDPTVTITDSSGKKVAEGVMPFGWGGTCGYSWRVPKDIKLADKTETFTITVRYDTQILYGKVEDSRKIIVTAE